MSQLTFAQDIPDELLRQLSSSSQTPTESIPSSVPLLEGPVDPDLYILGPGDVFRIQARGPSALELTPRVDPEGWLLLGEFGSVQVGGLTLAEGRDRIRQHLTSYLRNTQVDIWLREIRQFKIYVLGQVASPGAYPATAATRASEVILLAGGLADDASMRTIRILRRGSDAEIQVDLAAFRFAGDLEANPFLADGDRILVPVRGATFSVQGGVARPGTWDLRAGDTLEGVLDWIRLQPGADSLATLARFREPDSDGIADRFDTLTVNLGAIESGGLSLPLQNGDRVYVRVRPLFLDRNAVHVGGLVRYPGSYPIAEGTTRLRNVIASAGGLLPGALASRVSLIRRVVPDSLRALPSPMPLQSLYPDTKEAVRLYLMTSWDVDRMTVDLEHGENPFLMNGDEILVPISSGFVRVAGEVTNPGLYPVVDGWKPADYLTAAGGTTGQADAKRTRLIRGPAGSMTVASETTVVEADDIIVVPEKLRRQPRTSWDTVRDVFSIVGVLATVILVIDQVNQP